MKKIKILVDGHWFDDLYQSPSVFLKGLYDRLKEDNEFELFIAAHNTEQLMNVFNQSTKITYLKLKHQSKYYRLLFDFPSLIRKHSIDVTHYQYIAPAMKRAKEIVTIHDVLYKDFPNYFPLAYRLRNDFFFSRSARRADLITTVSNYSAEAIVRHYAIPSSRIKVVPNGIGEKFFEVLGTVDVRKKYQLGEYILCVSRIEPRKNHLLLVKAYCELELWKSVQLVLVGRRDIRVRELDEYLSSLDQSVRSRILQFENVNSEDLTGFYKQSLLTVYPSLAEGFGIPPLEAAALQGRVLCSNTTAMSDFTFLGESLFDPTDLEVFKVKLMAEISRPADGREIHVSQEVKNRYDWDAIAGTFANEVKELFF